MEYTAIIRREGRAQLASFPDCPGCHTETLRASRIEALAQEALAGWLEAHLVGGRVPPLPSGRTPRRPRGGRVVAVPVPPGLAARFQLRAARHEAGLTQAELAKKVGVSQQHIAALESPDANITLATLEKVAQALGREVTIELRRSA